MSELGYWRCYACGERCQLGFNCPGCGTNHITWYDPTFARFDADENPEICFGNDLTEAKKRIEALEKEVETFKDMGEKTFSAHSDLLDESIRRGNQLDKADALAEAVRKHLVGHSKFEREALEAALTAFGGDDG